MKAGLCITVEGFISLLTSILSSNGGEEENPFSPLGSTHNVTGWDEGPPIFYKGLS